MLERGIAVALDVDPVAGFNDGSRDVGVDGVVVSGQITQANGGEHEQRRGADNQPKGNAMSQLTMVPYEFIGRSQE